MRQKITREQELIAEQRSSIAFAIAAFVVLVVIIAIAFTLIIILRP